MRYLFPGAFFLFICWIIYLADSGQDSLFFQLVRAIPYGDKLGHVVLYGLLAFLLNLALRGRSVRWLGLELQRGALIVLAFALLEEATQAFFPNRTLDWVDILSDVTGVVMFSYLSLMVLRRGVETAQ